jgi:hypothetical protein
MDKIILDDIQKIISGYEGFDRDLFLDLLHENRMERAKSKSPAHKDIYFVVKDFALKMFINPKDDEVEGLRVMGTMTLANPRTDYLGPIEKVILDTIQKKYSVPVHPQTIRKYRGINTENYRDYDAALRFTFGEEGGLKFMADFPKYTIRQIDSVLKAQAHYQKAIEHIANKGMTWAEKMLARRVIIK